jgi:hypothetical protein
MSEVGQYQIDVTVDGKEIVVVQEGYLSFTQKVEDHPWLRVKDVNGVLWQINTRKVSSMKIVKLETPQFKNMALKDEDDE